MIGCYFRNAMNAFTEFKQVLGFRASERLLRIEKKLRLHIFFTDRSLLHSVSLLSYCSLQITNIFWAIRKLVCTFAFIKEKISFGYFPPVWIRIIIIIGSKISTNVFFKYCSRAICCRIVIITFPLKFSFKYFFTSKLFMHYSFEMIIVFKIKIIYFFFVWFKLAIEYPYIFEK